MYVHTYVHCENRSLIQSLALMRSAIIIISKYHVTVLDIKLLHVTVLDIKVYYYPRNAIFVLLYSLHLHTKLCQSFEDRNDAFF